MFSSKWCRFMTVIVVMSSLFSGSVFAENDSSPDSSPVQENISDISLAFDLTHNGKYVWRGINTVDGNVLQPSGTIAYRGLSFNVWGNMDLDNTNGHSGDFTEIDLTLDYTWSMDTVDLSVGSIYYTFPHSGGPSTTEIYAGAALDVPLNPSLTVHHDIDEADGSYLSASVGHVFEDVWKPTEAISMGTALNASVAYGTSNFNDFYYGSNSGGLTDALFSFSLPISLPGGVSIEPALNYSTLIDSDIRDNMSNDDNFWAGVTLSYDF